MKLTPAWLAVHLDTEAGLDEICRRLTMLGLEVEEVLDRAQGMEDFVVGRVIEAGSHPDADRLRVCTVDAGAGTAQVVCGAPNARAGMMGVFAPVGTVIPGTGLKLKAAKIRGVESNGMLLSERELGLSDEHEVIIELDPGAVPGAPAADALGLADPVIDIAITPNRGDCLSIRGIARDLAAAGVGTLKPLDAEAVPGAYQSPIKVHLDFGPETADACPYFAGRYVRGVTNSESPGWVKERLESIGLRPISALVDITNLLTIELGRPLHVFDADKIEGDIHVRLAQPGETLAALDGKAYEMDGEMTVIADDAQALALGGVMGGEGSGCTTETTNVYLESALFDPRRTAATGRKLNLMSDARFRFERGIDPAFLEPGMEIATRLVLEFCGGEPSHPVIAGAEPEWRRDVTFRPSRVLKLGGVRLEEGEARRILGDLGFAISGDGDAVRVAVPSWRNDIDGEADLVEEVVRVYGYERIPSAPMERATALPQPALGTEQRRRSAARRTLAGRGLVEAVTLSFMPSDQADLFGGIDESQRLINPISSDLDVMRPSVLPNLIAALGRNADRGIEDAALFEVGPQYSGSKPEDQATLAAGVRAGVTGPRSWAEAPRPVDAFDVKADARAVIAAMGLAADRVGVYADAPPWYHPGRSGVLGLGPKTVLAAFGEVHPRVLRAMDVKGPVAGFEIFLDRLPESRKGAAKPHLRLSSLHTVERDFAFVIDEAVTADAVLAAARDADRDLIAGVGVFDVFTGGQLGEGKKSLAINVVLQPADKTLTEDQIEAVADKVVAGVKKATGGVLRS